MAILYFGKQGKHACNLTKEDCRLQGFIQLGYSRVYEYVTDSSCKDYANLCERDIF